MLMKEYVERNTLAADPAYPMALRAVALGMVNRKAEAIEAARKAEAALAATSMSRVSAQVPEFIFELYVNVGAGAEALRFARQQLQEFPGNLQRLDRLAWLLATHPDRAIRNGKEAVRLAEKARRALGERDFNSADTLAAALAETGRFAEAARLQAVAVENARSQRASADKIKGLEARLADLQARKRIREAPQRRDLQDLMAKHFPG